MELDDVAATLIIDLGHPSHELGHRGSSCGSCSNLSHHSNDLDHEDSRLSVNSKGDIQILQIFLDSSIHVQGIIEAVAIYTGFLS
jgi:hypothetical protein